MIRPDSLRFHLVTRYRKVHLLLDAIVWYLDYFTDRNLGDTWTEVEDYYSGQRRRAWCGWLDTVSFPEFVRLRLVELWHAPLREFAWEAEDIEPSPFDP